MTVNALLFFIHSCIELHGVQLFIRSYVIIREWLVYLIYCVHKLLKSNVAWKQFSLSKPLNRTLRCIKLARLDSVSAWAVHRVSGVLLFVNKLLQYKINLIIFEWIVSLKSLPPREGSLLQKKIHVKVHLQCVCQSYGDRMLHAILYIYFDNNHPNMS